MEAATQAQADIDALHSSLHRAYRRRLTHVVAITAILFIAAMMVIAGLALIIYRDPAYAGTVVTASTFQVLVLISVILALVIHGMSVGRMTSLLVGILRTSIGLLQRDMDSLSRELLPNNSSMQQVIDHIRQRLVHEDDDKTADPVVTEKEQQYLSSTQQLRAIMDELQSTRMAAEGQLSNPDLASFAYGFAAICVMSSALLFVGSTEQAEFPRVLMITICLSCALACFAVLRRPTGPQFVIEQSLRKMGLSMEALTDSLRSRDSGVPPQIESDDLVTPPGEALERF